MNAIEIKGTVKRTNAGALVAEVWSGHQISAGQVVTVGETTAKVLEVGRFFKRGGYGFKYLYLDAPTVAPSAPTIGPSLQPHNALEEDVQRQQREDAEDRGEIVDSGPSGIEIGHI